MADESFKHETMVPGPAGVAAPKTTWLTEDGIMDCYGTTVPTDETTGYAIGCLFRKTDGGDGTALYVNEGTGTSCNFNAVTVGS